MSASQDSTVLAAVETTNPFPGLRPFTFEESHLFFGREQQIDEVVKKLAANRFVAVVGISGIGKSSFMYCGLLPILYNNYNTAFSSDWKVAACRPGYNPIKNLAAAIADMNMSEEVDEERKADAITLNQVTLQEGPQSLVKIFKKKYEEKPQNYLLFIDQFEELFRFSGADQTEKKDTAAFVELITEAVKQVEIPIYIVITLRSDFVGDCSKYPQFTKLINDSQFLIPQMTREEKRLAVTGPISVMGASIDGPLVEQILDDVGDSPDALPIMQHALMRTWDYWKRTADSIDGINISHYQSIGGMKKALSVHANEVYNELNDNQKKICEKLFKTITVKGDEGRGVRKPGNVKDISIIAGVSVDEVVGVIEHFRKPGTTLLMPPHTISLDENSIIDISHESLMRIWVMLSNWVEEESESVKLYLRLAEAGEMHQLGKAGLWRPPDLQIALNWLIAENPSKTWGIRYDSAFERTMLFLDFSKKQYEKEQLMKEKLQKRRLLATRITAIVLGLGAVIAFLFFLYGEQQRREAEKQRAEARKQSVVAQEQADIAKQESEKAKLSEIKALEQKQRAEKEAERALRNERIAQLATKNALFQKALAEQAHEIAITEERKAYNLRLLSIANSMAIKSLTIAEPEQKGLVAQQAYLFNKEHGGKQNDPDIYSAMYYAVKNLKDPSFNSLAGHTQNVRSITSSHTGKSLYSAGSDGKILKWDFSGTEYVKSVLFDTPNLIHKTISVSPDNKYLVSGGDYGYIQLFDLTDPASGPKKLKTKTNETWFAGFTADSKGIVSVGSDKKVLFWDLESSQEITTSDSKVNTVAISPKDRIIVVGKGNGEVTIVARDKGNEQTTLFTDPDGLPIVSLAYSQNGLLLAAGNEKGIVRIWDMTSKTLLATLTGHTARVNNIRFSNDGLKLATASFDKTVRIWDVMNIFDPPIVLKDHDDWVWSIEFSPDGERLLAGCKDQKIRVWPTNIELMKDLICGQTSRNLNKKEWTQFVADDIPYEVTCTDNK